MKAKKFITLCLSALLALSLWTFNDTVKAEETVQCFTTSDAGVTVSTSSKGITTVTGTKGQKATLSYTSNVDFTSGAYFKYVIPKSTDIEIDSSDRTSGKNYIIVTAKNSNGYGVEFKIYALYSAVATTNLNKMQVDVTYLDPTVTKAEGTDKTVGRQYLETFETYQNVEDYYHTIDIHKESGEWFFASDGLSALPVAAINNSLTMTDCSVSFAFYSENIAPTVKVYPVTSGILKAYTTDGFMQLGSDVITYNDDDTVKFKIADMRAAQYPGTELRYREQLISTVGYDVRKPINIEYSYDVSNASAVWYALGLGRPDVLKSITKLKYDVNSTNGVVLSDYSDSLASGNDGIMLQTTTGMAQPTYAQQNSRLSTYKTNSASKPYSGRENIDLVTFIVKEDGTDMYMNGTLIFDKLVTKLSDFESNGYMAYPYFHFFEDKASTEKGNTIVIKGINAPILTDKTSLKIVGDSNTDLTVGLDNIDNGDVTLYDYKDGVKTAVDPLLYSYDTTNKSLNVKYAYFIGKSYGVYELYARNNSGSEEITVRFSDPSLSTLSPTIDKDNYEWILGAGAGDLLIKIDIKNGTWVSFAGGGITSSNYTYTPGTDSTVGTITVSKDYLNGKKAGIYTYTVKTTNVEEENFTVKFTVTVKNTDDSESESVKKGCSGETGSENIFAGSIIFLGAAMLLVLRKKEIIKQ